MSAASGRRVPSTWFQWHARLIQPNMRVLDLACGEGLHAIAAAKRGAKVVAVDNDPTRLEHAERAAEKAKVTVRFVRADLSHEPVPDGRYGIVLQFDYLDRRRLPAFLDAVEPGGYFLAETFLEQQRELGWGPTADEHLLKTGELWTLLGPFEIVLAREVVEILDGRTKAVASVLARRPPE